MYKLCYNDVYFDLEYAATCHLGVVYASVLSSMTNIKMLARQLNRKARQIRVGGNDYTTTRNAYKIFTAKIPGTDYGHAVFFRKDMAAENESSTRTDIDMFLFLRRPAGADRDPYIDLRVDNYPAELEDLLFAKLKGDGHFHGLASFGIISEWMPYLMRQLIDSYSITPCYMLKLDDSRDPKNQELFVYNINVSDQTMLQWIQAGLLNKEIQINGTNTISEKLSEVEGLNEYLNAFGDILANRVQERFTPRFVPGRDPYSENLKLFDDYAQYHAGINIYPAQNNVIQAVANCLSDQKFAFIAAQMGAGKTLLAIGSCYTSHTAAHKMLNIIFCPDHLVKKWRDEIERFAPLSDIYIVDSFAELVQLAPKLKDEAHRYHNIWLILAKDTAKYGYDERPAAVWNEVKKCYCCPTCGKPLYTETEDRRFHIKTKNFFGKTAFLRHNTTNHVCMHKNKVKEPKGDGTYKFKDGSDCNTKLWEPVVKNEGRGDWVKLGNAGWIERRFIPEVYEDLNAKKEAFDALPEDRRHGKSPFKARSGEDVLYRELKKIVIGGSSIPPQRAPRKFSLTKYLLRYFKHKIDYFIADELHEYKSGDSIQGEAFGDLVAAANRTIGLTGTLMNGYASGLYYLLYRTCPQRLRNEDFEFKSTTNFVRMYGKTQEKTVYHIDRRGHRDNGRKAEDKEMAGASPMLFTRFLLNNTVFMDLSDIAEGLPDYEEIPIGVDMDDELRSGYQNLYEQISANSGDWAKGGRIMGQALVSLTTYPDMPYDQPPIFDPQNGDTIATPLDLPRGEREKERRFLDLVEERINEGENVLVYYNWTNRTDTAQKLTEMLEDAGIRTATLKTSGEGGPDARDRQIWIESRVKDGVQVLLCNPRLVETGLDLLDFTSIIWYQMGNNLFTMRQACRRSLRLNQTHDIKVYFLYYRETIQEAVLANMADKVKAARALEGHFSEEGLNALSHDDDMETRIIKDMTNGIQRHLDEREAFRANTIHNENRVDSLHEKVAIARNTVSFTSGVNSKKKMKVSFDDSLALLRAAF